MIQRGSRQPPDDGDSSTESEKDSEYQVRDAPYDVVLSNNRKLWAAASRTSTVRRQHDFPRDGGEDTKKLSLGPGCAQRQKTVSFAPVRLYLSLSSSPPYHEQRTDDQWPTVRDEAG